ncbi:MAG: DoxX family protein [candidate division KSB1 bacterium]
MRFDLSEVTKNLLRCSAGAMLCGFHGLTALHGCWNYWLKGEAWEFINMVSELGFPWPSLFASMAALAESFGAALLALGAFTRYSAAGVAFTMAIAAYRDFLFYGRFDLPGFYALVALFFVFNSPGEFSIDAKWRR